MIHEPVEMECHIAENRQQDLSFDVHPANIAVRNLGVEVDVVASFVNTLRAKLTKFEVGDVEGGHVRRGKISEDVSADFPAGTLTAIIGSSLKVRLHIIQGMRSGLDSFL